MKQRHNKAVRQKKRSVLQWSRALFSLISPFSCLCSKLTHSHTIHDFRENVGFVYQTCFSKHGVVCEPQTACTDVFLHVIKSHVVWAGQHFWHLVNPAVSTRHWCKCVTGFKSGAFLWSRVCILRILQWLQTGFNQSAFRIKTIHCLAERHEH